MSTDEEQQKYLQDAIKIVKEQAFYMKRAMDGDSLKLALDHATEMLRELRTNLLTSKNYYELYMRVLDELRELEEYISSLQRNGRSIVEIYEQVQSCGAIVPRLYLMICVGGVYISSLEAPAKDILNDIVEMVKGVQHPMRGLFLRNYLTQVSKNRLPDINSPYEGSGGTVQDSIQFILQNFIETNRLWVRLQNQGVAKDRKKREKERLDLRILIGTNLVRLSQLEGLDVNDYKNVVLPKILEEVVSSKDVIAQNYLMDCLIQVFPDEFHIATLDKFLTTCTELKEKVNVRNILESLMDRLSGYTARATAGGSQSAIPSDINAFKLFNDCVTSLIENRSNMTLAETLKLQTALINFALKCYPNRIDYVTHCLTTSSALIDKTDFVETSRNDANQDTRSTNETTTEIESLLSAPLSILALKVLDIPAYGKLMTYLPWGNWKQVALNFLQSVITRNAPLTEVDQVELLFNAITPLLRDREGTSPAVDEDGRELPPSEVFVQEQQLVAKVIHLMKSDDTDSLLRIYIVSRKHFTNGGTNRIKYTLGPLVFGALSLARRVKEREKAVESETEGESPPQFSSRKVFQFVLEIINTMATAHPDHALRLFLQSSQAADQCSYPAIAYEFVKEALLIYESDITDSKSQVRALTSVIGTLLNCANFPNEDYEALITKVAQYANKLLKKPDQSRMVTLCSHLFWPKTISADGTAVERYSDPERVLECLQRSLKIASVCNTNLFVEILDRYLYNFENDNPSIQVRYLSGLIALINEQLGAEGQNPANASVQAHYRNTIEYIKNRQRTAETKDKYAEITL
eukprot:CAMPEP_0196761808 /NCGR_PEP_ID=MMETSP1095-20130614/1108_1 /TAXON_ID=96789 ORGANISM="Chromulina nebulosa, Strain UTEXLB2642" /NCGR_SAMPLE_ID=MMETSP1095 /ASSEMBLY_ACC=CAM_ASM_000446 /LENGTH=807 /DNA_ID=CAMNT_0042111787 /DNA_START=37 /DNA_END=2460 /DNA_ORIENTATION=+